MAKILPIAQLGAPVIREIAQVVTDVDSVEIQAFIDDLMLTCNDVNGMGIAAPQVYKSKRIFIMSSQPNERYPYAPKMEPTAIINPEIIWYSKEIKSDWEGCLTLPGVRGFVPRYVEINVSYTNRKGKKVDAAYQGFLARLFQHEFDHLNGIVFIDRVASTHDVVMENEFQRIIAQQD